jgi:hypothetical protein
MPEHKSEQKGEQKSQIPGVGYGSTHRWVRDLSVTQNHRGVACHYYQCSVCREGFVHFYEQTADHFAALRADHVHEMCPGAP